MTDFEHISRITSAAKLNVTEIEEAEFKIYMKKALNYVEILKEVDADLNSENLADKSENETTMFRSDEIEDSYSNEALFKNALSNKNNHFIVPNTL